MLVVRITTEGCEVTIGFKVGLPEVIIESVSGKLPLSTLVGTAVGDMGEAYEFSPERTIELGTTEAGCSSWMASRF